MSRDVVACGALALHIDQIAKRRGWDLEVRPLPPELHNRPERIRAAVEAHGDDVVGVRRLRHPRRARRPAAARRAPTATGSSAGSSSTSPGRTTSPTSSSARFDRVVWRGLGLDRHPELRDDYFGNYERVVWLAQAPTRELQREGGGRRS